MELQAVKVVEAVDPTPVELGPASGSGLIPLAINLTSGPIPSDLKTSSALQIVYNPHQSDENSSNVDLTLCIFTRTEQERDDWLWSIRLGKVLFACHSAVLIGQDLYYLVTAVVTSHLFGVPSI